MQLSLWYPIISHPKFPVHFRLYIPPIPAPNPPKYKLVGCITIPGKNSICWTVYDIKAYNNLTTNLKTQLNRPKQPNNFGMTNRPYVICMTLTLRNEKDIS